MENYNKELENNLLEMVKQKEQADKRLLSLEIVIGMLLLILMLALTAVASFVPMAEWLRILLILIGFFPALIATPFMLKIEQTAGYYVCKACGHKYVPTFSSVLWSAHMGRTRYMKCPQCGKKTWNKKVLQKEA